MKKALLLTLITLIILSCSQKEVNNTDVKNVVSVSGEAIISDSGSVEGVSIKGGGVAQGGGILDENIIK